MICRSDTAEITMFSSWIVFVSWVLILEGQAGMTKITKEAPALTLKKCVQTEEVEISCEDFKPAKDKTEMVSQWPPGPYVTPMTRYGCPETSMHGWREGSVSLTWQKRQSVYVSTRLLDIDATESFVDTTTEHFFNTSGRHSLVPRSQNTFKLFFCYKYRSNVSLDIGTWPDESFSIYGTGNSCPPEFEKINFNESLPKITRWDADGYLPDFKVFNDEDNDTSILQLLLCSRKKANEYSSTQKPTMEGWSESSPYRNWTSFLLIKDDYDTCPTFQHSIMFEETLIFNESGHLDSNKVKKSYKFCYYETDAFPEDRENWLFPSRVKNAHQVYIAGTTNGNVTESLFWSIDLFRTYYHLWISIDLGRTIAVSAIELWIDSDCDAVHFGCFISGEQWSFLYSEALSCLYVPICRINKKLLSYAFKRIMEGRYVTVYKTHDAGNGTAWWLDTGVPYAPFLEIAVYTEILDYNGSGGCNYDLGMGDLNIEDDQISASSSLSEFPPLNARPYHAGWCPELSDEKRFLQVVFAEITTIDGITLYNKKEIMLFSEMQKLVSFTVSSLTLSFADDYDTSVHNRTIYFDVAKLYYDEYTIRFLRSINAKSVKLSIEKPSNVDLTCLRFELHGCRLTEKFTVFDTFERKLSTTAYVIVTYAREIREVGTVIKSIGFPDYYQRSHSYKWIIRFPVFHYIKLVFTDIEFNTRKLQKDSDDAAASCNDALTLSAFLDGELSLTIDNSYKVDISSLSFETRETMMVLTVVNCLLSSPINRGKGFRAVATYQDIPACFSLAGYLIANTHREETCSHPTMFITSMSYLGNVFQQTTEIWHINIRSKRINVQILDFNIHCRREEREEFIFKIITLTGEKSYCNINRPPKSFNITFGELTIHFAKTGYESRDTANLNILQGFRIFYTKIDATEESLIDYMDAYSEVRNVALDKMGDIYILWKELLKYYHTFTDGHINTCFTETKLLFLDLQEIYTLEYVVIHGYTVRSHIDINYTTCVTTLLTGMNPHNMQVMGYHCGKIAGRSTIKIMQEGITAKYIQISLGCMFRLCNVQVYGKEVKTEENSDSRLLERDTFAFREWGEWSSWTDECYCGGKQFRHRYCDILKPQHKTNDCPGDNISQRSCQNFTKPCKDYQEPITEQDHSCKVHTSGYKGFSMWSEWSSCSSECGHGLMFRTRTCTDTVHQCVGDVTESRPCTGNGTCLICSKTFSKCYSIIAKYTNWQQARMECFKRNMTLLSILSQSELRFVKYNLLKRRHKDSLPNYYFDADFYVHIGLRRENRSSLWENGIYALYFTAWKRQPSEKHCTRMNFQLFDDDNTWESEDCQRQLAEYTMCEYQKKEPRDLRVWSLEIWKDTEMVEVPEQIRVSQYDGEANTTISGRHCINGTYCREDLLREYLTCSAGGSDGNLVEECSVNLPAINSSVVYYKYLGILNTTFSGKTCQRWDTTYPHQHNLHGNLFKGEGISDAGNYCRDPNSIGYPWCLTTSGDTLWEPCLINEIKTERRCTRDLRYTGTRNTTVTGKTCLRWDTYIHGFQDSEQFNIDLSDAENYCRDPRDSGYNWCYTVLSQHRQVSEPCQIEDPETLNGESKINRETISHDKFICKNGEEIPKYLECDGKFDCKDQFDETECSSVYAVHPMIKTHNDANSSEFEVWSYFKCKSDEWVSIIVRCDGIIDCLDASDEMHCNYNSFGAHECTKEQFRCADGDCIHISQVCNFIDECIDASDEYCDFEPCSRSREYRCDNGLCIPLEKRCDAIKQCTDGSDESECDVCQPNIAFHCDVARCIPIRLTCDNYAHCEDGTDELSCDVWTFKTCQEVWDAGYRKSGFYSFGTEVRVECYFQDVFKTGKIRTELNFDLSYVEFILFFFNFFQISFFNVPNTKTESDVGFLIFNQDKTSCIQQMKQFCRPSYENFVELSTTSVRCYCGIINYEMNPSAVDDFGIEKCPVVKSHNTTPSRDHPVLKRTKIANHLSTDETRYLSDPYHLYHSTELVWPGPAICTHDFISADNDFTCNINGKHIPIDQRCLYDIDNTGYPTGCRDGSHLIDCESYECPPNTLKCPDSYCVPIRFLCDGQLQCPGGEDEDTCGCEPSTNEVLIIYDEETDNGPNINMFARQFKSLTNIVRVLSYKPSKPLESYDISNVLLDIRDVEINRIPDLETLFECRYKRFARTLLDSVHFTNDGIRAVLLLQNSEISTEVFSEIIKGVTPHKVNLRIYRVSQTLDNVKKPEHLLSNFTDIRVRRWRNLNGIGAEYFGELCKVTTKVHCPNGYKCAASKACIPLAQVCDSHIQCLHGDDEMLCQFQCPDNCKCSGYISNCSATDFNTSMIYKIPKNTKFLDLSSNEKVSSVLQDSLLDFMTLSVLNVSKCNIELLSRYAFIRIKNLQTLDLSYNRLRSLSGYVFSNLVHLTTLYLRGNFELSVIETHAFHGLSLVQELDLANAKLVKINKDTFAGLKLKTIDLSNNKIEEVEQFAFRDSTVENINIEKNTISLFNKEIFTGLIGLKTLRTPAFKFCCIRPNYVAQHNCFPHEDEFSSCDDLMRHSGLQFMIWLLGITALLGNILTVIYRFMYDKERLKLGYGFFVTNLAVADLLMAIYLMTIAIADSAFRKRYIFVDDYWRHSFWCNMAGVLSTISSEASVLFLCLITLDRLLVIKFPFGRAKITFKTAVSCAIFVWLFSVFVAILPVAYQGYFNNEFYSKSGVCIALPLTRDRPPGWSYSLGLFVCLNFVTFILVAFGQVSIFIEIRKSSGIATSVMTARKRDLKVARNLLLVVTTDFMCWFPIGIMGLLALSGHVISGDVYAWAAVFILPVNSALNPLLYTLSAIIGAKKFNPNTEEQSFTRITKDIGDSSRKCLIRNCDLLTRRNISKLQHLKFDAISAVELRMSAGAIAMIGKKLARCLDGLHSSSLGLRPLEEKCIFVGLRNQKFTGAVRIKAEPFISLKSEDKSDNIYQLGIVLRRLIAKRSEKTE